MFDRNAILASAPFRELQERVRELSVEAPLRIRGLHGSLLAFAVAAIHHVRGTQILLVVPEKDDAEQVRDDCALLLGESRVRLAVAGPSHESKLLDMSAPIAQVEALRSLSRGEPVLTIVSAESLVARIAPAERLRERSIEITKGNEYPFEKLLQRLSTIGFERTEFVGEYGDVAVRGGIVDVYPFIGENPIRFEFWGDTLESIREFDALSQRSIRELQSAVIIGRLEELKEAGDQHAAIPTPADWTAIPSYLASDALIVIQEPALVRSEVEELHREGWTGCLTWDEIEEAIRNRPRVEHSSLFDTRTEGLLDVHGITTPAVGGSVKRLVAELSDLSSRAYSLWIACDTTEEQDRLRDLIDEELTAASSSVPPVGPISFVSDAFHAGFIYPTSKLALFTEHEIFGRLKRRGTARRRRFKGISQKELQQLRRGDHVVHADYGIGRFAGLQKIRVRGVEQEVMKLLYLDNDVLYVNLNFVNRVQKYSSQEGHMPALSKLGGGDWDRLKAKARRKIKDIARDLIALYARRKLEQGVAFAPDTHWQREMEASFLYEDTPDQAKATADVKEDMERPVPMDRLICGDVGFGKTEVAVRAAFKAVMNGKQVAVLVPTTILAAQHYNTFLDRLGRYSVRAEHLTRFRSSKEIKAVITDLQTGKVDIVIGTHRLLSKDISFKDLGLLIIDEEQRFGVTAKEKLRRLRATVDTLTLTATPIPRTLQFSLLGARDLSLINTPPRNRLPIITEIAQFDIQLIREAILKELHRGGQVFFVHDRVQNIDEIRAVLEEHVPGVRFHVAHGQMPGHELEKTMLDFLEKRFDVLLCTKIIESGIDIPSVNTMIINRADRFGLAELYQLRGRVGRSNVQAYAYLLTPPLSVLPRQTLRRLQAIQEFTELGSGFNLAMRDLEIRGAGNLLGGEQSGFILEMGFEMYQRIVEQAVAELKEQEFADMFEARPVLRTQPDTFVEADIEALIPEVYIESDGERLDIYRRLYRAGTTEDLEAMRSELMDRFGEYPVEVESLIRLVSLKIHVAQAGFTKVELEGSRVALTFPPNERKEFYEGETAPFLRMMAVIPSLRSVGARLQQEGTTLMLLARVRDEDRLRAVLDLIGKLKEA